MVGLPIHPSLPPAHACLARRSFRCTCTAPSTRSRTCPISPAASPQTSRRGGEMRSRWTAAASRWNGRSNRSTLRPS
eukprot:scaffold27908_cov84-Isochrysis_galbana.AAC.1